MLLFSERTWKHHCVMLVVPFAVLSYALAINASDRRLRRFLIATLILSQVLMATTSTALWPDDWAKLAEVYGAYVGVFLLLVAAQATVLAAISHRARNKGEVTSLVQSHLSRRNDNCRPRDRGSRRLNRRH